MQIFLSFFLLLFTNQSFAMITPDITNIKNKELRSLLETNIENEELRSLLINMAPLYKNDSIPTTGRMDHLVAKKKMTEEQCIEHLKSVQPIISARTQSLYANYYSKIHHNDNAQLGDIIYDSYANRPIAYVHNHERNTTCYQSKGSPQEATYPTGTTPFDNSHTNLPGYLSPSERLLSPLLGIASKTQFINTAGRFNSGKESNTNDFIQDGYLAGLVGACFETENLEWKHMIITQEQNTTENDYGIALEQGSPLYPWAQFYNVDQFPSFEQVQQKVAQQKDSTSQYHEINNYDQTTRQYSTIYFDKKIYKQRMNTVIAPFLDYANEQGKNNKKHVYVHAVGLGLGAWALKGAEKIQQELLVEIYLDIIKEKKFEHIGIINFSYLPDNGKPGQAKHAEFMKNNPDHPNLITISFSNRNIADRLKKEYSEMLLVAQYAWDGFAHVGNEFWLGDLISSDDPAAVAGSNIAGIQTPFNPYFKKNIKKAIKNNPTSFSNALSEEDNERFQNITNIKNKLESLFGKTNAQQGQKTKNQHVMTNIYVAGGIVTLVGALAFLTHYNYAYISSFFAKMIQTISNQRFTRN